MDTNEHIINLVAKNLQGELTITEQLELQSWLNADLANQAEYEKLEKIWLETNSILSAPSFDTDAAWKKIDAKITTTGTVKSKSKPALVLSLVSRKRIAVAAAAIIFFAVGLFFLNRNNSNWQTITAEKGNLLINLPDRSVVLLRKGSTIKYPVIFDAGQRLIALSGEAFFDVQRNEQQPFIISTANSKVKVLGTSFLVRSKDAIDEVVVVTGKVSFTEKEKASNQVMLTAGQKAVLLNESFQQSQVNDANYISWKNGTLDFKDASLVKVLEDVSNYFEIPIEISNLNQKEIEKIRINVRFEKQSLTEVLDEIKLITGLEVKKENGKTIFFQK